MNRWLILLLTITLLLAGCDKQKTTYQELEQEEAKKIQIGMVFDTFVVERWKTDRDVFVSTARDLGAEVNVQNSNGDVMKQIEQMDYLIDKKMDVIVVVPIDSEALIKSIRKAKDAGIKVISYDRLATNSNTDLYISFDNEKVGTLMGKAVSGVLSTGDKVILVLGPMNDKNVSFVKSGICREMENEGIEIMDTTYIDGWKAELASQYINKNIEKVKQVQAIICGNDNLASQVISALSERRLAGNIFVVGQDADLEACQRIVEDTQFMTVYKPFEKLAQVAAKAAVDLAKGIELETDDAIMDGSYRIPYIKLEPLAVTKKNIDAIIIDSNFHLKEDVYINRPDLISQ